MYEIVTAVLMALFIVAVVISIFAAVTINQRRKKPEKEPAKKSTKTPIIRSPTGRSDKIMTAALWPLVY